MLKESTLSGKGNLSSAKKKIEILIVDYQSKFSLDLLSMLVNIKGFTSPRERSGINESFSEECGNLLFG